MTLKWIVLIWSAIRACLFLFNPSFIEYYGEIVSIGYLIYFGLVIWAMIDDIKRE